MHYKGKLFSENHSSRRAFHGESECRTTARTIMMMMMKIIITIGIIEKKGCLLFSQPVRHVIVFMCKYRAVLQMYKLIELYIWLVTVC